MPQMKKKTKKKKDRGDTHAVCAMQRRERGPRQERRLLIVDRDMAGLLRRACMLADADDQGRGERKEQSPPPPASESLRLDRDTTYTLLLSCGGMHVSRRR